MMCSTLSSFASSSFTPKLNNLSKKKNDTVMMWDPWDLSSPSSLSLSEDSNLFSVNGEEEMATTLQNKTSFEDLLVGVDNLERSLSMRQGKEMDLCEQLGKLAGEDIPLDTIEEETETESAVGGAQGGLYLVQELKRRVKEATDRINAKDDACDLIYSQWQKTQAELDEKTKSESVLLLRVEKLEQQRLKDKDVIDDLQFRLFMAESNPEEKKHEKPKTLSKHAVQSPATKGKIPGAKGGRSGTPLSAVKLTKSDIAMVPQRVDRSPVKRVYNIENRPSSTCSLKTQPLAKKPKEKKGPTRRGFFFGFSKAKKYRGSGGKKLYTA